ncbi:MAG: helix-turn-helix domain-containing protein [Solirubrobacteraceae bacterium]
MHEWEMQRRSPDPRLRGLVHSYTGYVECAPAPLRRLEAATMTIPMILSLGPGMIVAGERFSSFVAGPIDGPTVTEHAGEQLGIEVNLTPPGARRLLGVPLAEIAHRVVEFADLLGRPGAELIERLGEAPDWAARFALLDAALLERLVEADPLRAEVAHARALLDAARGCRPVEGLAREVGWSRRHLAARFKQDVGVSPKTAARILRFERVTTLLRSGRAGTLADAAYACGYADQAHLHRDFRAFAGTTPTDYAARVMPAWRGVAA